LDDTAISLAFALAVLVAVYVTGNVSGAHLNPAVTIALAAVRKFPWSAVPGYVIAQLAGAILAALTNWAFFGSAARSKLLLGATHPGIVSTPWVVLGEFLLTLVLMVTIMSTAVDERSPGPWSTGLATGLVVGAGIFVMLPVTGGSFNPARTLGPMIVSGQFPGWWAYVVGPIAGAVGGAWLWLAVLRHGVKPGAGRQPD
jgi:MIP family channel proteins